MRSCLLFLALGILASAARGDQLAVTGQTKEGDFQRYENGRFQMVTLKGRFIKEQAGRVTKLVLDKPLKVAYVAADSKEPITAEFKGYDKRTFTFVKDGKDVTVAQMKMKTIERVFEGGGEGGQEDGTRYPIPNVNLEALAGEDLTPAQQAVIDKFTEAKKTYDAFLDESTDLVHEMDRLTGAKREEIMNQLRARKNDEQPLKKALIAAFNALTEAFPEPADEPAAAKSATKTRK